MQNGLLNRDQRNHQAIRTGDEPIKVELRETQDSACFGAHIDVLEGQRDRWRGVGVQGHRCVELQVERAFADRAFDAGRREQAADALGRKAAADDAEGEVQCAAALFGALGLQRPF